MTDIDPRSHTHSKTHIFDPIREWLLANGVDLHRTPSWPDIQFGEDVFRIQQLTYRQDGEFKQSAFIKMGGHGYVPMRWVEMPLVVPMGPDLQAEYPRLREDVARSLLIEEIGRAGANVISVGDGDSLIFVFSSLGDGSMEAGAELLHKALPGVKVVIVDGCEAVIKAKGVTQ